MKMKTNERDALVALRDTILPAALRNRRIGPGDIEEALQLVTKALAAPAEGGQGEAEGELAKLLEFFRGEGYQRFGWEGDVSSWSPADTAIKAMRSLLCPAAPAEGGGVPRCKAMGHIHECRPKDGGTLCQWCGGDILQQPADGDGAVADALTVVNDAANDARHAGDYAKANALVRARVTLYRASTRPAATAQVPYPSEEHECTYQDGDGACQQCNDLAKCDCQDFAHGFVSNECPVHNVNPRPKPDTATPKGGVVDAAAAFDDWYAEYDGIGGPKNPEQLARDAWTAALNPEPQS